MAVIKNFLYNSLTYTINNGFSPAIINNQVVKIKNSVPNIVWQISFGLVKNDLKNYIERTLFYSFNDLFLATNIFPDLKLFKITGGAQDFYTYRYTFEEEYYGTTVYDVTNRKLFFTTDGTYDYITDGTLVITIAAIGSTIIGADRIPLFTHYLDKTLKVKHSASSISELSAQLMEFFTPTDEVDITETITYVGASDASDSGLL